MKSSQFPNHVFLKTMFNHIDFNSKTVSKVDLSIKRKTILQNKFPDTYFKFDFWKEVFSKVTPLSWATSPLCITRAFWQLFRNLQLIKVLIKVSKILPSLKSAVFYKKNEAKVCWKRYVVQGCTKNFEKNKLWETLINCGAFFSDFTVMSDGHYI